VKNITGEPDRFSDDPALLKAYQHLQQKLQPN
jgi:hypothetical protein